MLLAVVLLQLTFFVEFLVAVLTTVLLLLHVTSSPVPATGSEWTDELVSCRQGRSVHAQPLRSHHAFRVAALQRRDARTQNRDDRLDVANTLHLKRHG
jgi:hypothetical protein